MPGQVRARAKTWVKQPARAQFIEPCLVSRQPGRLDQNITIPIDPEPRQILNDRGRKPSAASGMIDILDPQ